MNVCFALQRLIYYGLDLWTRVVLRRRSRLRFSTFPKHKSGSSNNKLSYLGQKIYKQPKIPTSNPYFGLSGIKYRWRALLGRQLTQRRELIYLIHVDWNKGSILRLGGWVNLEFNLSLWKFLKRFHDRLALKALNLSLDSTISRNRMKLARDRKQRRKADVYVFNHLHRIKLIVPGPRRLH